MGKPAREQRNGMNDYKDIANQFKDMLGYELNLDNPITFNEKIQHKKLFDRNPLIPLTSDKYRARDYIKSKIEEADNYLVPILYVTDKPKSIPFDKLRKPYILKANHGCKWNIIIEGEFDREKVIHRLCRWMNSRFGQDRYEWAYSEIKPLILVEKLIKDSEGNLPVDVKFWMFNSKCRLISVTSNTAVEMKVTFYSINWNKLRLKMEGRKTDNIKKPKQFDLMLKFAQKLSEPFDFVRIDYFVVDDDFYFSEISHYPTSGLIKFRPQSYDKKLGNYFERS